jgi:hypothetical protein
VAVRRQRRDASVGTRTAQKATGQTANVITYDYDTTFRRLSSERVTTPGTGVDQTVLSISRTYDSLGRREFITSHSDADPDMSSSFADAVNQVQYAYTAFGALDKEYQEHAGKVDGSSLHVDYAYDDATDTYNGISSVFTNLLMVSSSLNS